MFGRRHSGHLMYGGYNIKKGMFAMVVSNRTRCKWNESGFMPPLCTYGLNWDRRTPWGWWDEWDDTVLQTQDSKFEPWRSEAEHATSRSRRFSTILTFTHGWGRNIFVFFKPQRPGTEPRTLAWKAAVLTTTLGWQNNSIFSFYHVSNYTPGPLIITRRLQITIFHYRNCTRPTTLKVEFERV